MQETTLQDRRNELQALLDEISRHPERDSIAERERARVLSVMIAREDAAIRHPEGQ